MNKLEILNLQAVEECAEIAVRISKAGRFGYTEIQPGQTLNNAERINEELNDLLAVLEMIESEVGEIMFKFNDDDLDAKKHKVDQYLELSKKLGTYYDN